MLHRRLSSSSWNLCTCCSIQTSKTHNLQEKTRLYVVYIIRWFCINQHSGWSGNTVCHINHNCHYSINTAWNERLSATDNLRNLYCSAIYWTTSLLPSVICFNLLLVLLLPCTVKLLCKGTLVVSSWTNFTRQVTHIHTHSINYHM